MRKLLYEFKSYMPVSFITSVSRWIFFSFTFSKGRLGYVTKSVSFWFSLKKRLTHSIVLFENVSSGSRKKINCPFADFMPVFRAS